MQKHFFPLFSVILHILISQSQNTTPACLWVGSTQTGKSSSIKLLTGNIDIPCGNGGGQSTTQMITIYENKVSKLKTNYLHIDTIGFNHHNLKYNNQEIKDLIFREILNHSNSQGYSEVKAVIITESLPDSGIQLNNNVDKVYKIFGSGQNVTSSIIVIATKINEQTDYQFKLKKQAIITEMKRLGISDKNFIIFRTPYYDGVNNITEFMIQKDHKVQYQQLEEAIKRCPGIQTPEIKQKHEDIIKRAKQLQKLNSKQSCKMYQRRIFSGSYKPENYEF